MKTRYKLLISFIILSSIVLIVLTTGATSTSNYYPNSTNGGAWYGGAVTTPTLGKFRDTAYTSAQRNTTSVDDANYVEVSASGTIDYFCQGRTQVASCTGYSEEQCPNYYDASENACEFMGGEECVGSNACFKFPGHEILFKIAETRADINNLSVRVVSYGDRVDDGNTRTLAVYNWTKGAYITFMTSACTSGLSNVKCNLTANITDVLNFVNTTGYIDIILFDPSIAPSNSIRNYFDKVQINYNLTITDSCTYTSGNWNVQCSDNCSITTNYNLARNNITFNGSGYFYVNANITRYDYAVLSNNCNIVIGNGRVFG